MGTNNSRRRRDQRREDAGTRQQLHDKLSLQQRIELIDVRLGPGVGAARERACLALALRPQEDLAVKDDSGKKTLKKREARKRRNKKRGNR